MKKYHPFEYGLMWMIPILLVDYPFNVKGCDEQEDVKELCFLSITT
jgi:hypothetical protein